MREIKFRTFDEGILPNSRYCGDSGVKPAMCKVYTIHLNKGTMRYKHPEWFDPIDGPIKNLMQFTGLHDKNGKDIYEGDLLLLENNLFDPSEGENPYWIGKVEWSDKMLAYLIYDEHESFMLNECFDEGTTEVIGNICENPEFLEGE